MNDKDKNTQGDVPVKEGYQPLKKGYKPVRGELDPSNPPQGGSSVQRRDNKSDGDKSSHK